MYEHCPVKSVAQSLYCSSQTAMKKLDLTISLQKIKQQHHTNTLITIMQLHYMLRIGP